MSCSKQNSASSVFSLTVSTYCFLLCCVLCWVAQSCPILCNPMDWSPSGSSANGIFQARILEWVAMLSSRSSQLRDQTQVSHTAHGFFTIWTTREAHCFLLLLLKCTILTFISLALSAAAAAAAAKSLQSCLTLCNPTSYWNMGLFLGWVFQAQERQTVKERQKLSAPSAWALLQHKQGFPFFKLIPEDTDLWWTKILPPHVETTEMLRNKNKNKTPSKKVCEMFPSRLMTRPCAPGKLRNLKPCQPKAKFRGPVICWQCSWLLKSETFYLFLHSSFLLAHGWYPWTELLYSPDGIWYIHSLS